MTFTNRWRHQMRLTLRVWPRGLPAIHLSQAGKVWSVDGMTFNSNEKLEVVHRIGVKGFVGFELAPSDAAMLMDAGAAGAEIGDMVLRCPGTLDSKERQECWLDVNVTVYPKAVARAPKTVRRGCELVCGDSEILGMVRSEWARAEEQMLRRERRFRGKKNFHDWAAKFETCECSGFAMFDAPEIFDIDVAAQQILKGNVVVLDCRKFTGKQVAVIRDRLEYYVVPGRKPYEEGGLFRGYQLGGYVFRYKKRLEESKAKECTKTRMEKMHASVREKGAASRREYFLGQVVHRVATHFGVSEERAMSRFLEHGIVDYLIRSIETVEVLPHREKEAMLRGKISDAVRVVTFIVNGFNGGGSGHEARKYTRKSEVEIASRYRKWFRDLDKLTPEAREESIGNKCAVRLHRELEGAQGFAERVTGQLAGDVGLDMEAARVVVAAADATEFLDSGRRGRVFNRRLVLDAVNALKFLADPETASIAWTKWPMRNC